jgi:Cft2 family RNA processing exonuclease
MLLAESEEASLLYTGDFKLGASASAEQAELPHAEILVMECTFGEPRYRLPPRDQVLEQFFTLIRQTLAEEKTPVVYAYSLGKSQEVTRLLTGQGIPVLQHPEVFAVSQVYEACGCALGDFQLYPGRPLPGHVVVAPPQSRRGSPLPGLARTATFSVTGWAVDPRAKYWLKVDHALPLSDHADYDELFEAVRQVSPEVVFCTHGPDSFVDALRQEGHNAYSLSACRSGWRSVKKP